MDNELFIKITGDISGLQKSLKEAQKEVKTLKKDTERLDDEVGGLNESMDDLESGTKGAGKGSKDLGKQLKNTALSAVSLSAILTTGLALLVSFEKETGFFEEALTGVSKAQRDATARQEEYNTSLRSAEAGVRAQIVSAEALIGIIQDENEANETRTNAYNTLKEQFPDIVGGLDLQGVATTDLTEKVNALSEALINQAQITVLTSALEEEYKRIGELGSKSAEEQRTAWEKFFSAVSAGFSGGRVSLGIGVAALRIKEELAVAEENAAAIEKSINALILKQQEGLQIGDAEKALNAQKLKDLQAQREAARALVADRKQAAREAIDIAKRDAQALKDLAAAERDIEAEKNQGIKDDIDRIFAEGGATYSVDVVFGTAGIQALEAQIGEADEMGKILLENQAALLEDLSADAQIAAGIAAQGISAIGQSLVDSLEIQNDIVKAFVSGIIGALTGLLSELATTALKQIVINQAVSTSEAVKGATQTASASGPAAAFLLPALVGAAIGFIAASFSGIKFAQGGIVPGGSFTGDRIPALLNSGEMVLNAGQQAALFDQLNGNFSRGAGESGSRIEVVGIIRGDDILLSSKRAERNNNRFNLN